MEEARQQIENSPLGSLSVQGHQREVLVLISVLHAIPTRYWQLSLLLVHSTLHKMDTLACHFLCLGVEDLKKVKIMCMLKSSMGSPILELTGRTWHRGGGGGGGGSNPFECHFNLWLEMTTQEMIISSTQCLLSLTLPTFRPWLLTSLVVLKSFGQTKEQRTQVLSLCG